MATGKVLDGKKHAAEIRTQVKKRIDEINKIGIQPPHLAVVLVGENPASLVYIRNKQKACEETGINFSLHKLPETASQKVVLNTVRDLNENKNVHGILVQQPLPSHICKETIVKQIAPEKDVDCLSPYNVGLVTQGNPVFLPCTPGGIVSLLKREAIDITGKNAIIAGRSDIVGKPLALMFLKENATVTICHSKTQNLAGICSRADILVAAIGSAKFITADFVKEGAVVIDVGINRENGKLYGDVDFENVLNKASYITPVPGGVGPMTIATLMENCLKAWEIKLGGFSMGNIYLVSLGCDKNRVDGETMIGTLRNAGYSIVHDPADAQAIIVNTCGFIQDAVKESINLILELSEHKTEGNCQSLIIVGCMAQRYKNEIAESIPEADAIIGVGEYEDIANVVEKLIGAAEKQKSHEIFASDRLAARSDDIIPHIAYVKIAEGCDNNCTYCTIPSIRGSYKSREMEEILEESCMLVAAGAKELVLVAQDTTLYGTDIYGKKKLPELLRKLAETSGATWIRLMYAYPEHITDELIDTMAAVPQVCKYIDMPIQHSDYRILKKMGRNGFDWKKLKKLITKLRNKMPNIAIRTTVMVGFPGEYTSIFYKLCLFVKNTKFDRLGVFPYSREEGTPAAIMEQQNREFIKINRVKRIMELQQEIHFEKQKNQVGKILPVMVDTPEENGEYTGRTQWDAYEVDTVVTFTSEEKLKQGEVYQVLILDSDEYDLRGRHESSK